MVEQYLMKLKFQKSLIIYQTCVEMAKTLQYYTLKKYTLKHVMTVKGFILNIGHGLNENKFMNTTNVYSPKQK